MSQGLAEIDFDEIGQPRDGVSELNNGISEEMLKLNVVSGLEGVKIFFHFHTVGNLPELRVASNCYHNLNCYSSDSPLLHPNIDRYSRVIYWFELI